MVRNAMSMQNLPSNMDDMTLGSPLQHRAMQSPPANSNVPYPPSQHLQTLGSRSLKQVCGDNADTRALMNRVATGQASETDHAEWNRLMQLQNDQNDNYTTPSHAATYYNSSTVQPQSPADGNHAAQAYQSGLREQQLRMRDQSARQRLQAPYYSPQDSSSVSRSPEQQLPPVLGSGKHALQDYQMQLMLLEQQNKKRKQSIDTQPQGESGPRSTTASPQPAAATFSPWPATAVINTATQPQADYTNFNTSTAPPSPEYLDYQMQLMLLEQQNKKRLLMARQEQDAMGIAVMKPAHYEEGEGEVPDQDTQMHNATSTSKENQSFEARALADNWQRLQNPPRSTKEVSNGQSSDAEARDDGTAAFRFPQATKGAAQVYCQPFCDFLTDNPTVFHAVDSTKEDLLAAGWTQLSERDAWDVKPSGHYFVERNGSSLIAFVVGANYEPGNGAAIIAGHVDALTAKLKPVSEVPNKAGYLQLGVAPYDGGMNDTWWDRDLGIGGRVLIKEDNKIVAETVKLDWPIARIPTLAPHFGAAAQGPFNKETQMTPIIGLDYVDAPIETDTSGANPAFVSKQPPALVRAIGDALGLSEQTYKNIVSWELELFDIQPATVGGLNKEFIYGGRIDDKLCSWAAMQALTGSSLYDTRFSSLIKVVAWFDNEEIGSQLRQGAKSNFLPNVLERAVGSLSKHYLSSDLMGRTYANSFLLSSDVTHAVNPNFLGAYLDNHSPKLNTGLVMAADANGHMTTDAVSSAVLRRCADKVGAKLQVFQIRNDSRSGGTVGPMLSSMMGIRAIDAGLPQLSMHSIRAATGSLDPGLGVIMFTGFLNGFEHVDKEFRT